MPERVEVRKYTLRKFPPKVDLRNSNSSAQSVELTKWSNAVFPVFLCSLVEKESSYVTRQQKIVECISSWQSEAIQCFLFSLVEKKSSYVTRQQKIVECISSSGNSIRVTGTRIEFRWLESSYRNSRRHVQHIFGPRIVEWPGYANMQIFMLIRQLDGFDPHKITKLRANSNSNSKLKLDEVWKSPLRPHLVSYSIYLLL